MCQLAGVVSRGCSRRLQRVLSDVGLEESFHQAPAKLQAHYGIEVPVARVRRVTEAHGRQVERFLRQREPAASPKACMVLQSDGSMLPVVDNTESQVIDTSGKDSAERVGDKRRSKTLAALLGEQAQGLSAATVSRLKRVWEDEYRAWRTRDFKRQRYVYVWVDGIYFNVRGEEARQCLLVMIGVDEWGRKALLAVEDGYRESAQSWREVLVDVKARGFTPPALAVGDGALGFWAALREVYPTTRTQRCWVHKMANIFPTSTVW